MPSSKKYSTTFKNHDGKVSDKWASYLPFYDEVVDYFEGTNPKILEIGVQNGGSLEIWSKLFPSSSKIVGVDINETCALLKFDHPSVNVVIGDATESSVANEIFAISPNFDLIVDDGSHRSTDILNAILTYLPKLNPGGIFVIEDLHAVYWKDWEGGLANPKSAMHFLRKFSDLVNREHWGVEINLDSVFPEIGNKSKELETVIKSIISIEFRNSICAIKLAPLGGKTTMNPRLVVGTQALIEENKSHDNEISSPPKSSETLDEISTHFEIEHRRHLSNVNMSLTKKVEKLASDLENSYETNSLLAQEILDLKTTIQLNQVSVNAILSSYSWKITKPLRILGKILKP